jgi:hypothetical protein
VTKKEKLKLALEELTEEKDNIRNISKKYRVPKSTLHYNSTVPIERKGNNLLTLEEEKSLVEKIKERQRGEPMSKLDVLIEVRDIINSRPSGKKRNKLPSDGWWRSFKKKLS